MRTALAWSIEELQGLASQLARGAVPVGGAVTVYRPATDLKNCARSALQLAKVWARDGPSGASKAQAAA